MIPFAAMLLIASVVVPAHAAGSPPPLPDGTVVSREAVRIDAATASGAVLLDRVTEIVDGHRVTRPDARYLDDVVMERVTYASDGLRVTGFVVRPRAAGRYPCLVVCRGGAAEFGAIDDTFVHGVLARFASWGYVVAATQYRGVAGGEGKDEQGGADVDDVLNLLPLLEHESSADATHVGIVGFSRGGTETFQVLARTGRFAAAVTVGAPTDMAAWIAERPGIEEQLGRLVPEFANNRAAALEARSPVRWAKTISPATPILVLHGGADEFVDPHHALDMAAALSAEHHVYRLVVFEGDDHSVSGHATDALSMTRTWLDRYVRGQKP